MKTGPQEHLVQSLTGALSAVAYRSQPLYHHRTYKRGIKRNVTCYVRRNYGTEKGPVLHCGSKMAAWASWQRPSLLFLHPPQ
eukprot:484168-Pelagomonas_calceolata.AAC.1